jgi:predicted HD phosphohydrolase
VINVAKELFDKKALDIHVKHRSQTIEDIRRLNEKYQSQPAYGKVLLSDMVQKLQLVIDPTDKKLYHMNQWGHCLQVIHMMELENADTEEFIIAALIHDLGKILLFTGEHPENVVCDNFVVGEHKEGAGLDNVLFQWNHDEFGYMRLKDHIPVHLAKLIRYHSINSVNYKYLSSQDVWLYENYLRPFSRYDKESKSITFMPELDIDRYLRLLDKWFPQPILI